MALMKAMFRQNFSKSRPLLNTLIIRKKSAKAQAAYELPTTAPDDLPDEHIFNEEHIQMRNTLNKIIEKDINPYVEEWERERQFPAHKVFKKLGDAGLLGVTKPIEFGGLGLDYSYSVALAEELGNVYSKNKFTLLLRNRKADCRVWPTRSRVCTSKRSGVQVCMRS